MKRCTICGKTIRSNQTYCGACLNDPTPIPVMRARHSSSINASLPLPANRRRGLTVTERRRGLRKAGVVFLSLGLLFFGGCVALVYWTVRDAPTSSPGTTVALKPTIVEPSPTDKPTSNSAGELSTTSSQPESPQAHIIQDLGNALTDRYAQTSYEVNVEGSDSEGYLRFDCSNDPKDVCFMLYKSYPDKDEAGLLREMGIRRLYFSSGLLGKTWTKEL